MKKTIVLFPDYMSQFVGMAKELYDEHRIVQEYFEEASQCLNVNFVKLCFASSETELARPEHAYPAIFLVSIAIAAVLKESGIEAAAVAGAGIGYISALCVARALSMPDGLYFLSKYAQSYNELMPSLHRTIFAIKNVPVNMVTESLSTYDGALVALIAPTYLYVSIENTHVSSFSAWVKQEKGTIEKIPHEFGFHSTVMKPVIDQLRMYVEKIDITVPTIPVYEPLYGTVVTSAQMARGCAIEQVGHPIRWDLIMNHLHEYEMVIQAGPGTVLTSLLSSTVAAAPIIAVNTPADVMNVKKMIIKE